jgi:hypothetical protein
MPDLLVHNVYRDGQWVAEIARRGKTGRERRRNLILARERASGDRTGRALDAKDE